MVIAAVLSVLVMAITCVFLAQFNRLNPYPEKPPAKLAPRGEPPHHLASNGMRQDTRKRGSELPELLPELPTDDDAHLF